MEVSPYQQARILAEALPYMQRYDEATSLSNTAAMPWGRSRRRATSPATSCCRSRPRSIR